MHPFGLDCICEHPCATKPMERLTEWCVSPSLRRQNLYPQKSLTIVVSDRIQALMMASNVSVEQSATGTRQVSPIPTRTNEDPRCRAQPATITLAPAEAATIYFHNFATFSPANHH